MSAFVVSDHHINAILTGLKAAAGMNRELYVGAEPGEIPRYSLTDAADLQKLGTVLLAANVHSVAYRYPRDEPEDISGYRFRLVNNPPTALQALKLCQCLDYQCCEPPEWSLSYAKRVLVAITDLLITKLPGYESAAWAVAA